MTCDERCDRILLYAADALDDAEALELRAHLESDCAQCTAELERASALLADLPLALEPVAPSERVRERLLSRVSADLRAPQAASPPPARRSRWIQPAAASVISAVLAAAVMYSLAPAPMDESIEELELRIAEREGEIEGLRGELAEQDRELGGLEDELADLTAALDVLRSPELEVMEMRAAGDGEARARLYWDLDEYTCYLYATRLAPLEPGSTYVLWLVTEDGELVRAGSVQSDRRGEASLYTRLRRDLGRVTRAMLSREADPPGETPTGPTQLEGSA